MAVVAPVGVVVTVATDAVTREREARRVVLLVNLLLRSVVDSVVAVEVLLPLLKTWGLERRLNKAISRNGWMGLCVQDIRSLKKKYYYLLTA